MLVYLVALLCSILSAAALMLMFLFAFFRKELAESWTDFLASRK